MHVFPCHADEVVDSKGDEGKYDEEHYYDDCDDVVLLHVGRSVLLCGGGEIDLIYTIGLCE